MERLFGHLRRPTFMRRRGTSCMLPRSRADETLGHVTFCRKTSWFQHTFPVSPESYPGGSRMPKMPSKGSWVALQSSLEVPQSSFWILLQGFFQDSSSEIPSPGILLEYSSSRVPPPGFHLKDSSLRIPPPGSLLEDSCCSIPLPGFLLQDSSCRIPQLGFLLKDSSLRIPCP